MNPNKSPGPDGLTSGFYKAAWSILGDEVVGSIQKFFSTPKMASSTNSTILTLIPKTPGATTIKDFRPISCCNTVYKAISKLLVARIKPLLPKIILPNQPAVQQQQLPQADQNAYLNAFKMQNGHLQQWQQQSDMPSPSFMKRDFTESSKKFATTASPMQQTSASPGSGDGNNLLNFSITGQSVLPEQLTSEGWSPKVSNTFTEPLSLPQAYAGKSLALEPQNPSLFGSDHDSGLFLPSTVPRFGSSSGDAEASPMSLTDSGFQNSLYGCMQDTTHELLHGAGQINPSTTQTKNFVKVYKSGSVGRSLDISRFSSYHELREELGKMFAIEGLLEDPLRSGWQLVFVDKENDILLLGDDPWESFVNNVWYIKILSPEDVQQMGDHGEGSGGGSFPQNPNHL